MPDFTPVEISLARQLALPREFREGDWVIGRGRYNGATGDWSGWSDPYLLSKDAGALANRGIKGAEYVWLPSIEDCFELLREAEWSHWIDLNYDDPEYFASSRQGSAIHDAAGNTPREALYRLLLEVRG